MRSLALRALNGMVGLRTPKNLWLGHPIADVTTWPAKNWDHYCVPLTFCRMMALVALVVSGEDFVAVR